MLFCDRRQLALGHARHQSLARTRKVRGRQRGDPVAGFDRYRLNYPLLGRLSEDGLHFGRVGRFSNQVRGCSLSLRLESASKVLPSRLFLPTEYWIAFSGDAFCSRRRLRRTKPRN